MSLLLDAPPYSERDEVRFLAEMNSMTRHHWQWCPPYRQIVGTECPEAKSVEDLPFVHVGLFKRLSLVSHAPETKLVRNVLSSSTSGVSSRIALDESGSRLQSRSSQAILADFIGSGERPLLILDSAQSLRRRDDFSARIMAAMSLKPFASEVFFLLKEAHDPASLQWQQLECALKSGGDLLIYGFSWILWLAWATQQFPQEIAAELQRRKIVFVHSGGWKKLEEIQVPADVFDATLLAGSGPASLVIDYYGLVEQMGIVFPRCSANARHVPRWADVIVRDSWTLKPLSAGEGQLQLLNTLASATPCHNVLTEDMGRLLADDCPCGRRGRRFELFGRVPRAELRGCSNV